MQRKDEIRVKDYKLRLVRNNPYLHKNPVLNPDLTGKFP
jgi:hypothetical protein